MIACRSFAAVCGSFRLPRFIDEQRHDGQIGETCLARAVERGVGTLLGERVRFAIQDLALLDHGATDGLSQMTFRVPDRSRSR